jgi:hypothetical protein
MAGKNSIIKFNVKVEFLPELKSAVPTKYL